MIKFKKILRSGGFYLKNLIKSLLMSPFQAIWVTSLYKRYCEDPNADYLFITDHMGDTFIVLGLLESHLRKYKSNFVAIVREDFQQLVNYFPSVRNAFKIWREEKFFGFSWKMLAKSVDVAVYLNKTDKIFGFSGVLRFKNLRLIGSRYKYYRKYIAETRKNRLNRRMDKYLSYCIGLSDETFHAGVCVPEHYVIQTNSYMKEYDLVPEQTVILAPYSNSDKSSCHRDNILMFEKIAALLKEKGYIVCTNVDPVNREPIKGTKPISPPIGILIPLSKLCGYVVTYRSGFADVAACSGAKLFVFYPEYKIFGVSYYDYTSVKAIYQKDDIIEVVGDRNKFVKTIEETIPSLIMR